MTQTALSFDRPKPDQLFKPGSQNHRLYSRLLEGPVDNGEIIYRMRIANSTGRCSDIRRALRPHLLDVKSEPVPGTDGQWVYSVVG